MTHQPLPPAPAAKALPPRRPAPVARRKAQPRVVAPFDVQLPHPDSDLAEMRVPASINGTHLATGRL
jgi:hypothetical protein